MHLVQYKYMDLRTNYALFSKSSSKYLKLIDYQGYLSQLTLDNPVTQILYEN